VTSKEFMNVIECAKSLIVPLIDKEDRQLLDFKP